MSNNVEEFKRLYESDEDAANKFLGELHETDITAYLECVGWYVGLELPPGVEA